MNKYTHLGVYGVLIRDDHMLLIQKARGPHTGKWDLPGGTIEFGEEPYHALQREFLEETGITQLEGKIRTAASYTLVYPYRENELEELHHIGIIYDIELKDEDFVLKTGGDDQDSLGARWIPVEAVLKEVRDSDVLRPAASEDDLTDRLVVTPFVKEAALALSPDQPTGPLGNPVGSLASRLSSSLLDSRIGKIRAEERSYHEACYDQYRLFESGSWLHKPVKTVMDMLGKFVPHGSLSVLDLGCGVGRNSIPIAAALKQRGGSVVCVDLLDSALDKLAAYSAEHGVSEYIEPRLSDIADYSITPDHFDYIVAVSALEHVASELQFVRVLNGMANGTKAQGINCIIMNTNIEDADIASGDPLEPLIELQMTTDEAKQLLAATYEGWEIVYTTVKPLQFTIDRGGRSVLLKGDCLTWAVQKMS